MAGGAATLGIVAWWGCAPPPEGPAADRFVSLSPAITDTVVALGAADTLVGRSDWCSAPEVARVPALGSALTPALEGLVGVRPTRILVAADGGAAVDALGRIAPVEALPWLTVAEVAASTRRIGEIVGRVADAEALAVRYEALDGPPPPDAPRVLLLIGAAGPGGESWFVKRNSLHGQALHAAGYRNAVDEDVVGAPTLTAERVVALDPDAVVMLEAAPVSAADQAAAVAAWSALGPVRAVRDGRVSVLASPEVLAAGPQILGLPERLRAHLAE